MYKQRTSVFTDVVWHRIIELLVNENTEAQFVLQCRVGHPVWQMCKRGACFGVVPLAEHCRDDYLVKCANASAITAVNTSGLSSGTIDCDCGVPLPSKGSTGIPIANMNMAYVFMMVSVTMGMAVTAAVVEVRCRHRE